MENEILTSDRKEFFINKLNFLFHDLTKDDEKYYNDKRYFWEMKKEPSSLLLLIDESLKVLNAYYSYEDDKPHISGSVPKEQLTVANRIAF